MHSVPKHKIFIKWESQALCYIYQIKGQRWSFQHLSHHANWSSPCSAVQRALSALWPSFMKFFLRWLVTKPMLWMGHWPRRCEHFLGSWTCNLCLSFTKIPIQTEKKKKHHNTYSEDRSHPNARIWKQMRLIIKWRELAGGIISQMTT